MSARKSKVVKVNISAGTYKDEAEAVREANAIKRWLIRYCEKNGYSIKGKVWISTNSAYAGRIINKGRKKEYKPNGKPLPTVVEAHIHMVLFCNPASTIVDALKSYLNKKHMKAVVWDRHCNSRVEVENAVEYAMRQSRKVRTIDYDRKDVLSVDEWGYYEAVEKAEAKIKNNMAFTKTEPEHTPETLENKSVPSISDTPETLTYKSIKHNYLYYIVPTFYNRSIIKALLQNVIYYGRESSRRYCSKNIIKKVLLKVPLLLKKMLFYVIIIMVDEESMVLIMEIMNSYILLDKEKEKQEKSKVEDDGTIVIEIGKNVYSYILSVYPNLIKHKEESNIFRAEYDCNVQVCSNCFNIKFIINEVVDITYLDVVKGKNRTQIIKCLEEIQNAIFTSGIRDDYIDIVSYDAISEYYCNKILPKLNALERNLRKLLFNIYIVNFGKNYYQATINKELQDKIKGVIKAKGNKEKVEIERLRQFFYSFEFNDIQKLLFLPNWTDLDEQEKKNFLDKNKDLSKLSDEELRSAFSKITPKSDWERFFSSKINFPDIEEMIEKIRQHRNNIAHFKFFYKEAYTESNKLINKLNTAILKAIKITEDKDFIKKNTEHFRNAMSEVLVAFEKFNKTIAQAVIPSIQAIKVAIPPIVEQIRETCKSFDFTAIKQALTGWRDAIQDFKYELPEHFDEDITEDNAETNNIKEMTADESEDEDNA